MVYVRRPRGLPRFLGYCAIVGAYCLVYAGVQLAVALHVVYASPKQLMIGAVCAGWTLLVLALIINLGYLGRNRPYGYLAAMVLYGVFFRTDNFGESRISFYLNAAPAVSADAVSGFDGYLEAMDFLAGVNQ